MLLTLYLSLLNFYESTIYFQFVTILTDTKECERTPKVCEKHCREIVGSYECFCDSEEKLDDNGYSCESE